MRVLYGTKCLKGAGELGTIFRVTRSSASDGKYYGTVSPVPFNERGGVFRITSGGVLEWLPVPFDAPRGDAMYSALIEARDGSIYGTVGSGGPGKGGFVYRLARLE